MIKLRILCNRIFLDRCHLLIIDRILFFVFLFFQFQNTKSFNQSAVVTWARTGAHIKIRIMLTINVNKMAFLLSHISRFDCACEYVSVLVKYLLWFHWRNSVFALPRKGIKIQHLYAQRSRVYMCVRERETEGEWFPKVHAASIPLNFDVCRKSNRVPSKLTIIIIMTNRISKQHRRLF